MSIMCSDYCCPLPSLISHPLFKNLLLIHDILVIFFLGPIILYKANCIYMGLELPLGAW